MEQKTNKERLLRVIRGLQLIQRNNPTNSSIGKTTTKVLSLLLDEFNKLPADAAPIVPEVQS